MCVCVFAVVVIRRRRNLRRPCNEFFFWLPGDDEFGCGGGGNNLVGTKSKFSFQTRTLGIFSALRNEKEEKEPRNTLACLLSDKTDKIMSCS